MEGRQGWAEKAGGSDRAVGSGGCHRVRPPRGVLTPTRGNRDEPRAVVGCVGAHAGRSSWSSGTWTPTRRRGTRIGGSTEIWLRLRGGYARGVTRKCRILLVLTASVAQNHPLCAKRRAWAGTPEDYAGRSVAGTASVGAGP